MAEDPVAISPGVHATPVNIVTREEMSMVPATRMRFPGDAKRRLIGELARAIGPAAVPTGRADHA